MIFTSYFAKIKKFPKNVIPVAISAIVPDWYKGLHYPKLAPKYDDLMKYKMDHNEADYTKRFNDTTLCELRPATVLFRMQSMLNHELGVSEHFFWDDPDNHVALICYEKPSDFCHRHIVAEWLRGFGIECREWEETE